MSRRAAVTPTHAHRRPRPFEAPYVILGLTIAASKLNRVSYQGLILDFGGVVTTDLFAELAAFCVREGLEPGAFARVLGDDQEGRHAFEAAEAGKVSQRELEVTIGRLLGVDDHGLLTRALGGLRPRPEVEDLIQRTRAAGIGVGLLSNSWGAGEYAPPVAEELGMATVHFTDAATGIAEISRLLGLASE
jgi:hypothetical protein